jgi:NADPH-dependent ferric siderophore reductase
VGLVKTLGDTAGRVLLTPATVGTVTAYEGFRAIELVGERLAGTAFVPGDKLRLHMGGLGLRTYTPVAWDHDRGSTRLLAHLPGLGPGSAWCEAASEGAECRFLGPQRSVRLDRMTAAPVFVGDETSFGLLLAWHALRPDLSPATALFEVTDPVASGAVLDAQGATGSLVAKQADDGHLGDLASRVVDAIGAHPEAPVCLTGCAQTIAVIRRRVQAAGLSGRDVVVKAYWDRRRTGLD